MIISTILIFLSSLGLLGSYAYMARIQSGKEGYYQPLLFFTIALVFYLILIPWETTIKGETLIVLDHFDQTIDERIYKTILVMSWCAIIAFYLGQRWGARIGERLLSRVRPASQNANPSLIRLALFSVFLFFAAISFFLWHHYGSPPYILASALVYAHPSIPIAYHNAAIAGALFIAYGWLTGGRRTKILAVLCASALVSISFLFSVKTPLIMAGLSILYLLTRRFHGRAWIAPAMFVAMLMTVPMLFLFSMLRPGIANIFKLPELLPLALPYFSLMNSEQGGSFFTFAHTLYHNEQLHYGMTYLRDLALFVPRSIWPDRPLSVAEQFAQGLVNIQDGRGFSFSPFTEAYMNFGLLGALPHFLLFGLMLSGFCGLFKWMQAKGYADSLLVDIAVKVIGFFMVVMFFRNYFVGWIKMNVIMLALPMAALIVVPMLARLWKSRA